MKKTKKTLLCAWKFSPTASDQAPMAYGDVTSVSVKKFLQSQYYQGASSLHNLHNSGFYKRAGWCFDFRPFLRRFLVKRYSSWQEYYAPNKTLLRKSIYGHLDEIVEILQK